MRSFINLSTAAAAILLIHVAAFSQWERQAVKTDASFRGLAVVNEKVAWASGTGGTVIRTVDGGRNWQVITVPDAEKLDFRDIEAFDQFTAFILSIGNGDNSRIYKTIDGGNTWQLQFTNTDPKRFFDAIACWDRRRCIAMSDPVDGFFLLFETSDGNTWKLLPIFTSQKASAGEAAFAASGTCLIVSGKSDLWMVTGGTDARVLRQSSWPDAIVPADLAVRSFGFINGTAGSGIFSIAMFDEDNGVVVGGNYEKPAEHTKNLALTTDGGKTWNLGNGLNGYRSGVTYVDRHTIIAVGTNGSDISRDGGKTWKGLDKENYNAVQAKGRRAVWAVGPKGIVAKLSPSPL